MKIETINLEYKMPTVDQAIIRLDQALRNARSQRKSIIKIIHGYGSTGKGGAIKKTVGEYLKELKFKNKIKLYVFGEDFSPFSEDSRKLLIEYPELRKDPDYARGNRGITIVLVG